ncbi:MAG: enoyl-CoA hydratase-related protein, partial [Gemmatimonadetes bacterium]|nr:enoyl-CoA hydratase-related protein [Gemmatimonadota bacterium]
MSALSVAVADGVAVVTFDLPGEPVNKFSAAVVAEFVAVFDRLEADASVQGAVLISGKPDTFIAGADIDQFLTFTSAADAARQSAEGHQLMNRLEQGR